MSMPKGIHGLDEYVIDTKLENADRTLRAFMAAKAEKEAADRLAAEQVKKIIADRAKRRRRFIITSWCLMLLCIVFEILYHLTGNFGYRVGAMFEAFALLFSLSAYGENRKW